MLESIIYQVLTNRIDHVPDVEFYHFTQLCIFPVVLQVFCRKDHALLENASFTPNDVI